MSGVSHKTHKTAASVGGELNQFHLAARVSPLEIQKYRRFFDVAPTFLLLGYQQYCLALQVQYG